MDSVYRFPTSRQEWVAHLEGGPAGPFADQDVALRVAILEALRLRRLGRPARAVAIAFRSSIVQSRREAPSG